MSWEWGRFCHLELQLDLEKSLHCQRPTKLSSVFVGVKLFKHDGFLDVLLPGHTRFSREAAPFPVAFMHHWFMICHTASNLGGLPRWFSGKRICLSWWLSL